MKIALVTGCSSGIGLAALTYLNDKGYHVIGTVRSENDKKNLENLIADRRDILVFDVRNIEAMNASVEQIRPLLEKNGLSILINNAGMAVPGPLQYISEDDFEMQLDINVKAVRRVTNILLPYLGVNLQYQPGKIINISSVSGLFTSPYNAAYSISKFALEAMSDGYRRELASFGIKVAIIEPGPIKTEIWCKTMGTLDPYLNTEYGQVLEKADKIIANAEKSALPVSAITDVIEKIISSDNPRTRYLVHAKPFVFKLFTRFFSDKQQDKLVAKTMSKGDKHRPI